MYDYGVSINGGIQEWLVYFMENPNLKWMMTVEIPHFRKPPSGGLFFWEPPKKNQLKHRVLEHREWDLTKPNGD